MPFEIIAKNENIMAATYLTTLGSPEQMDDWLGDYELQQQLPDRIAIAGRSNVGKSSLINALVGAQVAQSSKTPGRTRKVILYHWPTIDRLIADLPGYGFAEGSKGSVADMYELITHYTSNDKRLTRLLLLLDARHGPTPVDLETMEFLRNERLPFTPVFTKADTLKTQKMRHARFKEVKVVLKNFGLTLEDTIWVSVKNRDSIKDLTMYLRDLFASEEK